MYLQYPNYKNSKLPHPDGQNQSKLRSFEKIEKQYRTEQEGKGMERMVMKIKLHVKKKEKYQGIKSYCGALKVKLPKLVITRFNSTHIDCFRFWNQFQRETDRFGLFTFQKFFYLMKLISPDIKVIIDQRKNILISKYGKPSEVANIHIQNIMSLPHINSLNLYKIHEFTEKLLGKVQALETTGTIKEVNGISRDRNSQRFSWNRNPWKFPQIVEQSFGIHTAHKMKFSIKDFFS